MKKVLAIISVMLILAMLAVSPVYAEETQESANADEQETVTAEDISGEQETEKAEEVVEEEDRIPFTAPRSAPIYYATNISGKSIPVIDGEITEGEYGEMTAKLDDHIKLMNVWPESGYVVNADRDDYCSESFDFYIAYDENFFYLAFVDYGSSWEAKEGDEMATFTSRNNYSFGIGFQLDDFTNYFSLSIEGQRISGSFSDGKLSNFTQVEGGFANIASEAYLKKYLKNDPTQVFCDDNINTMAGKNVNSVGQYVAVCEIKFDKKLVLERFNECAYTEYEELPNAMYFHFTARSYVLEADLKQEHPDCTSYNKYFAEDISGLNDTQKIKFYMDYGMLPGSKQEYIPSVVVFGEEGTQVYLPREIEEEETEPEIEDVEIVDTTPVDVEDNVIETTPADETTTPAVAEGGCGGAVSFAGVALVLALGSCTVFVAKKKED